MMRISVLAPCIWLTLLVFQSLFPLRLYGQPSLLREKREYSSSFGKSFILEFCDSSFVGRFIGSPLQSFRPNTIVGFGLPPPQFDGELIGTLHQGLWSGYWRDAAFQGKFAIQFNNDYSGYRGAFYRDYSTEPVWEAISGRVIDEAWTWEGKRSPVIAGVSSLLVPGLGHWYNREYTKANTYNILDLSLFGFAGFGGLLVLGNLASAIITGSGITSPSFGIGLGLAQVSLVGLIIERIVSIVDAATSAGRINRELDEQLPFPCLEKLPFTHEKQEIDSSYRAHFLTLSADSTRPPFWRSARNSIFAELGGTGVISSINYEYLFTDFFGLRAGFISDFQTVTILPVSMSFLMGASVEHKCEIGIGISTALTSFGEVTPMYHSSIGYRYQPASSGVLFRVAFTPFIGIPTNNTIFPWGGLSVGYTW